jgi:large subunit ribosomal protein L20
MTYSRFMEGLIAAKIELDRKVLADMAIEAPGALDELVAQSKAALENKAKAAA